MVEFHPIFSSSIERLELRDYAMMFFGLREPIVSFAAIDGSCDIIEGDRFISIYGGAYVSRGFLEITGEESRVVYRRSLEKDISYVAFIPVPPEALHFIVDSSPDALPVLEALSDREVRELTSMHTRVMELAEVYAAYDLARSTQDYPHLILLDRSLSGWLGNTSFITLYRSIIGKKVAGFEITDEDLYFSIAHPFSRKLSVPPVSTWLPYNRLIAEVFWKGGRDLSYDDVRDRISLEIFERGARGIEERGLGTYDPGARYIRLNADPRDSWRKMRRIFEDLCRDLFEEKDWQALRYEKDGNEGFLSSRELQFLGGVGLRLLIERCWDRKYIMLVGVVKDSSSRYFFRNYLGTLHLEAGDSDPGIHARAPFSDRTILETLPHAIYPDHELKAPWGTIEFDSCFMTILPQRENGRWAVMGYRRRARDGTLQEYTRPPRLFLRWLAQFLLTERVASHVLFLDRLAYPGWDDVDSEDIDLERLGSRLGPIRPLRFKKASRLQRLAMFLLNILVKNHFPEALGYPDPLHKADMAATAFRKRIKRILESSRLMDRARPLTQTFRDIRNRGRRVR